MDDDDRDYETPDDVPDPLRKPTGWEKFSVLLPALVAVLGLIAMIAIFAVLVSMSRS